ncbi:MAG: hypothetical protein ACKOOC_03495, partial [Cyanobium sp.]
VVRLELLKALELLLQVADFARISCSTGLLNVLLVFLDVLGDALHDRRQQLPAEVHGAHHTGPIDQPTDPCALVLIKQGQMPHLHRRLRGGARLVHP